MSFSILNLPESEAMAAAVDDALARVIAGGRFDPVTTDREAVSGKSREGYISFCDGAFRASAIIRLDDDEFINGLEKLCIRPEALDKARFFAVRASARMLDSHAEKHGINPGRLFELSDFSVFKKDPLSFFDTLGEEYRKVWNAVSEAGHDGDLEEDAYVRLDICAMLNMRNPEPLYCCIRLNFDDPYFRDYAGVIASCGHDAENPEILLGEAEAACPENAAEFSACLEAALEDAFSNLSAGEKPGLHGRA